MSNPTITFADEELSSLCKTGHTPAVLTGILRRLAIAHFSAPNNIQDPNLKDYIWHQDPTLTKIVIEPVYKWESKNVQQRPAIIIKRNPLKPTRQVIDNRDRFEFNRSRQVYSMLMQGSHTIFCIGCTGAEAEGIAQELFIDLVQFGPIVQRDFQFHRFEVLELGAQAKLEEEEEHFAVPINVGYVYVEEWVVTEEAPWLKTLALSLRPAS